MKCTWCREVAHNNSLSEYVIEPIHPVVDDWVDAGLAHGQPVEEQVDVTNVLGFDDVGVVVGDDEVDVVGSPADDKDGHHQGKHLDNLEI